MRDISDMQYEYIEQLKAEISFLNALFWDVRSHVSHAATEETLGEIDKICVEAIYGEPQKEVSDE